jgi:hypothetical protein
MKQKPKEIRVEFVETFRNKYKVDGYWSVTEIYGPNRIEGWRKSTNTGWILQITQIKETVPPSLFNLPRDDINHTGIGVIFAKTEKINELDNILFDHMRQHGIPYEYPYKYWLDPGEAEPY